LSQCGGYPSPKVPTYDLPLLLSVLSLMLILGQVVLVRGNQLVVLLSFLTLDITVSRSSTKAEYKAMADAIAELM
jgi:hypothetical protein